MLREQKGRKGAQKARSGAPAPSRQARPIRPPAPPQRAEAVADEATKGPGAGLPLRLWRWFDRHDIAFSCAVAGLSCLAVAVLAYAAHLIFRAG